MKNKKKLCPFKKEIVQEYGWEKNGKRSHTIRERLGCCAGNKCMAYCDGSCLRLKRKEDPKE